MAGRFLAAEVRVRWHPDCLPYLLASRNDPADGALRFEPDIGAQSGKCRYALGLNL